MNTYNDNCNNNSIGCLALHLKQRYIDLVYTSKEMRYWFWNNICRRKETCNYRFLKNYNIVWTTFIRLRITTCRRKQLTVRVPRLMSMSPIVWRKVSQGVVWLLFCFFASNCWGSLHHELLASLCLYLSHTSGCLCSQTWQKSVPHPAPTTQ